MPAVHAGKAYFIIPAFLPSVFPHDFLPLYILPNINIPINDGLSSNDNFGFPELNNN